MSFSKIDDVVIPVQDLSRVLQRSQVRHFVYHFDQVLVGDNTASLQWDDISDWTNVSADNIPITTDADLPATDGDADRLLTMVAAFLTGTIGEWNSSVVRRVPALAAPEVSWCWSAVSANLLGGNIVPSSPWILPLVIAPGEGTIELDTDITFAVGLTVHWIFEMMVAPQGVMASYPGV